MARAIFKQVRNQIPQTKSIIEKITHHVLIVGAANSSETGMDTNTGAIRIPLDFLNDTEIIQKTILLTENLIDADFYQMVGRVYATRERLLGVRINLELRGGGGNTTANEYQNLQNASRRICLCIVDSDKKCPNDAVGETARRVLGVNDSSKLLCNVVVTTCREAENMLSSRQLELVSSGDRNRMMAWTALEHIERSPFAKTCLYIDLKKGLELKEIYSTPNSNPRQYWEPLIPRIAQVIKYPGDSQCIVSGTCQKHEECKCEFIPGFGNSILDNVTNELLHLSTHKLSESVSPNTEEEWLNIGAAVLTWGCGGVRINV